VLKALTIRNLRCFKSLFVEPLERVNLIAGRNNVGKSSLLEGIWLAHGPNNPDLSLRVNFFRGIQHFGATPRELWGGFFFGFDTEKTIGIEMLDDRSRTASFRMRLVEDMETDVHSPDGSSDESQGGAPLVTTENHKRLLLLEYERPPEPLQESTARLFVENGKLGIRSRKADIGEMPSGILLATHPRVPGEDTERYSKLRASGEHGYLVEALKMLEPRLKSLDVLVSGAHPVIHGDVGLGQLIPLPLMGEGMVRMLSILLALGSAKGGTVLVDELENGFHHSVLPDLWRAIDVASQKYECQVFATTHSRECVCAAHDVFAEKELYDFRVHRLERRENETKAVSYTKEALAAAIESNMEIR